MISISVREPYVPAIVSAGRVCSRARTGATTAPPPELLYGTAAAVGAVIGGFAHVGSLLLESHPLLGSIAGGALGGAGVFGAALLVGAGR